MQIRIVFFLLVLFVCSTCKADIAGLSERDERVIVYRMLEKIYMNDEGVKEKFSDIPAASCKYRDGENEIFSAYVLEKEYVSASKCIVDVDTDCTALFGFDRIVDGRWVVTMSQIGYVKYFRVLTMKMGFPYSVIGRELDEIDKNIIKNIGRRLKLPIYLQKFKGEDGHLGRFNDFEKYRGLSVHEDIIARKWNEYVTKLPKERQKKSVMLEHVTGCGAGESLVKIVLVPKEGSVRIISDFDWQLCLARGLDPWASNLCQGWSQLLGDSLRLSGKYKYVAEWPGGTSKQSTIDVNKLNLNEQFELTIKNN